MEAQFPTASYPAPFQPTQHSRRLRLYQRKRAFRPRERGLCPGHHAVESCILEGPALPLRCHSLSQPPPPSPHQGQKVSGSRGHVPPEPVLHLFLEHASWSPESLQKHSCTSRPARLRMKDAASVCCLGLQGGWRRLRGAGPCGAFPGRTPPPCPQL